MPSRFATFATSSAVAIVAIAPTGKYATPESGQPANAPREERYVAPPSKATGVESSFATKMPGPTTAAEASAVTVPAT